MDIMPGDDGTMMGRAVNTMPVFRLYHIRRMEMSYDDTIPV